MSKGSFTTVLAVTGSVILGGALVLGASYFELLPKRKPQVTASPTPSFEVDQILAKIENVLELPKTEVPSLATVTDPSKLKNQAFFAAAEVGDRVLLYTEAGRAVLYRPKTGKVIEVGPFVLTNPSSNPLITATPPTGK